VSSTNNRLLAAGSPWPRAGNTMTSSPQTSRAANSRSRRCNHRVASSSRNRPRQGNPCYDDDNTRPSWLHSNLPANWRNHPHNCTDLELAEARSACSSGSPSDEFGSTRPSCLRTTSTRGPRRNSMDQLVLGADRADMVWALAHSYEEWASALSER